MFQVLSQTLAPNAKHFNSFKLNNSTMTELEENTFFDITFEEISLVWNKEMKHIHTKAFGSTSLVTKRLNIEFTPVENFPPNYNFFLFLSTLKNIEAIFCQGLNLPVIPPHAIQPAAGFMTNLIDISFISSKIAILGINAFYDLTNLEVIDLSKNNLQTIPANAFQFKSPATKNLEIDLNGMISLIGTGFQVGSLLNIKRPTLLSLTGDTKITYLDEKVFKPFLDSNPGNTIKLIPDSGLIVSFDCDDCKNFWIKKDPKIHSRTDLTKCSNKKLFTDATNFAKCH